MGGAPERSFLRARSGTAVLRILLGWSFFWAFVDKMFGLGFATCRGFDSSSIDFFCSPTAQSGGAMINGGSPTFGFLTFGTQASHTGGLFDWMASSAPDQIGGADIGFMVALLLGIATVGPGAFSLQKWASAHLPGLGKVRSPPAPERCPRSIGPLLSSRYPSLFMRVGRPAGRSAPRGCRRGRS